MLRKAPKSGYEIKAQADISTRFFWAISYGQIYPELKRLEQAGVLVGAEDTARGRRRRRRLPAPPRRGGGRGGAARGPHPPGRAALRAAPRGGAAPLLRRRAQP